MSRAPVAFSCLQTERPPRKTSLFDNLDDAAGSGFNQNRPTIYRCITILTSAILGRHFVVRNALFREDRSNSWIFAILIRGASLFDDIGTEARTLIDTKDSGDAADYATHNCTDWTCRSFTIPRTALDTSRDTLGLGRSSVLVRGRPPCGFFRSVADCRYGYPY
jgi:hypothetical protein